MASTTFNFSKFTRPSIQVAREQAKIKQKAKNGEGKKEETMTYLSFLSFPLSFLPNFKFFLFLISKKACLQATVKARGLNRRLAGKY